jgi:hypothetical protein
MDRVFEVHASGDLHQHRDETRDDAEEDGRTQSRVCSLSGAEWCHDVLQVREILRRTP